MQYGQTQNGMKWGLEGIQLSSLFPAFYLKSDSDNIFDDWGGNAGDAKNDFADVAPHKTITFG